MLGVTTNGLSFVRSLGRRGIRVWMLDGSPGNPCMRSRCGTPVRLPDIGDHPDAWLSAVMERALRASSPPVLIPTGDEHLLLVSEHREMLAPHLRFRIPPPGLPEILCDKRLQYEALEERGWTIPKTAYPEAPCDIARFAEETVGFPCLLKPYASHRWRRRGTGVKLRAAWSEPELRAAWDEMTAAGVPALLQEVVPGGDDRFHGYLAYYDAAGLPRAAFTKRKLRQHPPRFGNGSFQVSTRDPELADLSDRVLRSLNYQGLVGIEFKRDERDGELRLIEINPRSVSGNQLPIDCGVDFPYVYYRDAIGEPLPRVDGYRSGVRYVHLGWDVQAMLAKRRSGEITAARWLRSLAGVRSNALFSWRDARPALAYAGAAFRRAVRAAARGLVR